MASQAPHQGAFTPVGGTSTPTDPGKSHHGEPAREKWDAVGAADLPREVVDAIPPIASFAMHDPATGVYTVTEKSMQLWSDVVQELLDKWNDSHPNDPLVVVEDATTLVPTLYGAPGVLKAVSGSAIQQPVDPGIPIDVAIPAAMTCNTLHTSFEVGDGQRVVVRVQYVASTTICERLDKLIGYLEKHIGPHNVQVPDAVVCATLGRVLYVALASPSYLRLEMHRWFPAAPDKRLSDRSLTSSITLTNDPEGPGQTVVNSHGDGIIAVAPRNAPEDVQHGPDNE